jgi:hypothetical protein
MISIVFPLVIYGILKEMNSQFDILNFCKVMLFSILLIYLWRYFFFLHTKIKISQNQIEFKKLFKTSKYYWTEINFYFEKNEYTKYGTVRSLYIVKNEKIVERISEFEYSNYGSLKKNIKAKNVKLKVGLFKILKFQMGIETRI